MRRPHTGWHNAKLLRAVVPVERTMYIYIYIYIYTHTHKREVEKKAFIRLSIGTVTLEGLESTATIILSSMITAS
jgi:hypothetical protein